MAGQNQICAIDAYRTLAHGSITTSFVAVGTPFLHMLRVICLTNNTDGDVIFSTDGATSQLFVAAGGFKLFDLTTNRETATNFYLPYGTQFYVMYSTSPSKGAVYVEGIYGVGE